jgi:hypothetical protein
MHTPFTWYDALLLVIETLRRSVGPRAPSESGFQIAQQQHAEKRHIVCFEMLRVVSQIERCTSLCLHACNVIKQGKQNVLPHMHTVPQKDKRTSHKRASKTCECRLPMSMSVQGGTVRKTQISAVLRECCFFDMLLGLAATSQSHSMALAIGWPCRVQQKEL